MQNIRAFVPVLRDPPEVEVDCRPEDIGDPGTIMLLRLKKPLSVLDQDQRAEGGTIYGRYSDIGRRQNREMSYQLRGSRHDNPGS
jgi:hypothetical protein